MTPPTAGREPTPKSSGDDSRDILEVTILERPYRLVCSPDERPMLQECVSLVDARMRQIRQTGKLHGTDRIAVMAALGLARDLLSLASTKSSATGEQLDRIARITALLAEVATPQEKLFFD